MAYRLTNDVVRSSRVSKGNDSGRKRYEDHQRNRGRNQQDKRQRETAQSVTSPNKNNNNNAGNQRASARGRVHVIRVEETRQNPNLMTGTFLLNGHYVSVLFDIEADRSFVSLEFRPLLDQKSKCLKESYIIEYANSHEYEAREILLDCKLNLTEKLFDIDLIPFELKSFDVVIGMDWLTKVQAKINCLKKVLKIPLEGGKTLIVQGEKPMRDLKIVSAIKMRKYLKKECFAFLAHVVEKHPKVKLIQDIPIVRDYP
ncbi:reverse transcriptase domain-containing protein [Tanacetum coccineum]